MSRSLRGETPASKTASPGEESLGDRASALSSSAVLRRFALCLFSERTQRAFGRTPPGPGSDSETSSDPLDMLSSLSVSGRVALALTTDGIGCSCSVRFRTLTAFDAHRGPKSAALYRECLTSRRHCITLRDQVEHELGMAPIPPAWAEAFMGFPGGWTESKGSAMPLFPPSQNSSAGACERHSRTNDSTIAAASNPATDR